MPEMMKIGLAGLAPRRKRVGFTQAALAEALGIDRARLAMWETGNVWPSAQWLPKIADLLCCTIDDLYRVPDPIVGEGGDAVHAE